VNRQQKRYAGEERRSGRDETQDLWVVPYADFMGILMILFLMMYVFAYSSRTDSHYSEILVSLQKEMGGTVKNDVLREMAEKQQAEKAVMKIDEAVEKRNLGKYITVQTDTEKIRVTMSNPVLFDSGSADLKQGSLQILHAVATILKDMDNDLIVEGHSDNVPIRNDRFRSNWELSQSRAIQVIRYFVEEAKLPATRFAAAGYGEYRPVASNETDEGRGLNRRIEIMILREKI
jgi:chemotaxis protein MotB